MEPSVREICLLYGQGEAAHRHLCKAAPVVQDQDIFRRELPLDDALPFPHHVAARQAGTLVQVLAVVQLIMLKGDESAAGRDLQAVFVLVSVFGMDVGEWGGRQTCKCKSCFACILLFLGRCCSTVRVCRDKGCPFGRWMEGAPPVFLFFFVVTFWKGWDATDSDRPAGILSMNFLMSTSSVSSDLSLSRSSWFPCWLGTA